MSSLIIGGSVTLLNESQDFAAVYR